MGTIRRFLYTGFIPVTKVVLLLAGVGFLLYLGNLIIPFTDVIRLVGLVPRELLLRPWTIITYPFLNVDPISVAFAGYWFWFIGGSLERMWTGRHYGWFLFWIVFGTGVVMTLTGWAVQLDQLLVFGLWLPLTGLTWAWAYNYPGQQVSIWGVIPVQARWIAWVEAGVTFFYYLQMAGAGWRGLLIGVASLSGILVYYLDRGRGSIRRGSSPRRGPSAQELWEDYQKKKRRKKFRVIH